MPVAVERKPRPASSEPPQAPVAVHRRQIPVTAVDEPHPPWLSSGPTYRGCMPQSWLILGTRPSSLIQSGHGEAAAQSAHFVADARQDRGVLRVPEHVYDQPADGRH